MRHDQVTARELSRTWECVLLDRENQWESPIGQLFVRTNVRQVGPRIALAERRRCGWSLVGVGAVTGIEFSLVAYAGGVGQSGGAISEISAVTLI